MIKKRRIVKRGISLLLTAALIIGLMPVIRKPVKVEAEAGGKTIAGLGTSIIANPTESSNTTEAWQGSYVYFGQYPVGGNTKPIKYRVLSKSTTDFSADGSTKTMLLDCDSVLLNRMFDDGVVNNSQAYAFDWKGSDIQLWLNGTDFLNNTSVFTGIECNAIAESTKSTPITGLDGNLPYMTFYAPLNRDKIFLLDAVEASRTSYGYGTGSVSEKTRVKLDDSDQGVDWWIRSYIISSPPLVCYVYSDGDIYPIAVNDSDVGVSPAMNLDLSSILFSSLLSGTAGKTGAEYKLTLLDSNKTVQITNEKSAIRALDGKITVPYTYEDASSTSAEKVNQISILITDKAYTASDANILHYGALENIKNAAGSVSTVADATTGTGTFELPSALLAKTWGPDYHVYLLAEHVNATYATDYASTPIEITSIQPVVDRVDISIPAPQGGQPLAQTGTVTTTGLTTLAPAITWRQGEKIASGNATYNSTYTATMTLQASTGYIIPTNVTAKVNGTVVGSDSITYNSDGTITISHRFTAAKAKLISITQPEARTGVANGTVKEATALGLPTTVTIKTEDASVTTAKVAWDLNNLAGGTTYNPTILTEQRFTVNGTVTLPEEIDNTSGIGLQVSIQVTVNAGTPASVEYKIIEGADGTYISNEDGSYTIRADGEFDKFVNVEVDGKVVDRSHYTAKRGSTIITFTEEYLNSLSVGTHTIKMNFTDGVVTTTLTVKESGPAKSEEPTTEPTTTGSDEASKAPNTGDSMPIGLLFALLLASCAGLAVLRIRGRKEEKF